MHTFIVLFVAAYGLYIVIDLFTNIDEFQDNTTSSVELFTRIAEFYAYRASEFFAQAGNLLVVVSAIAVLGLLQKHSETFPLLAAGIPAFRLLKPLLIAGTILNGVLIANQEFIIPNIAGQLQTPRGSKLAQVQKVEPVYDYSNHLMFIDGEQVLVNFASKPFFEVLPRKYRFRIVAAGMSRFWKFALVYTSAIIRPRFAITSGIRSNRESNTGPSMASTSRITSRSSPSSRSTSTAGKACVRTRGSRRNGPD